MEAIRGDKYWFVHPGKRDALYVVALTRAKIPAVQGYRARGTHLGFVSLTSEAAPYCRRGRIIAVTRLGPRFAGRCVIPWPEFLKLIKFDSATIYRALLENQLPPFINRRALTGLLQRLESAAVPSL